MDNNARDDVEKVIVLMSDGIANRPDNNGPGYAKEMAKYAAGLKIKVYTISLGNDADLTVDGRNRRLDRRDAFCRRRLRERR